MAYTQKTTTAVAKIQGTAFVKVTVKKQSPNIPAIEKDLIKEANLLWKEMENKARVYFLTPKGTVHAYFTTLSTTRYNEYVASILKGMKDRKTDEAKRKFAEDKMEKYCAEYRLTAKKDLNEALAGIKGIFRTSLYSPFVSRVDQIASKYIRKMTPQWEADAKALERRWKQQMAGKKATAVRGELAEMRPVVAKTTNQNLQAQDRLFNAMMKEIRQAWQATYIKWRLGAIEDAMETEQRRRYAGDIYLLNDGTPITQEMYYPEMTTLRPFDVVSITAEDAPLFQGYPNATDLWVRVTPQLSSVGEVVSAARAAPTEVDLGSDVRFIVDDSYWDPITGVWLPAVDPFNYRIKAANVANPPEYNTLTYVSGKELISRDSFRISDGRKFLCDFGGGLDSLEALTISMVLAPNPQQRPYPVLDWYHASPPGPGQRFGWWLNDKLDFYYGDMGGSVDQVTPFGRTRPLVVTSVINQGVCTTTVGYSPKHNLDQVIQAKTRTSQWLRFQLGGSYLDLTEDQYADFSVFEINLWTRPLERDEVYALHSDYYSMYGVADDWR